MDKLSNEYRHHLYNSLKEKEALSVFIENGCGIYYELLLETESLIDFARFLVFLKTFSGENENFFKVYLFSKKVYKDIARFLYKRR